MRWERGYRSANVEDRRGMRPMPGRRIGLIGFLLLAAVSLLLGRDLITPLLGGGTSEPVETSPEEDELVHFVSFVLDDAQTNWRHVFAARGDEYRDAHLVVFTSA